MRLGERAAQAGHEVILAGAPGRLADPLLVGPSPPVVERLDEPPLEELLRPSRGLPSRISEVELFERALAQDRALFERVRPDLVVADNRRSSPVAAQGLGIPTVSLSTAALLGPHCAFVPTLDQVARIVAPCLGLPPSAVREDPRFQGLPDEAEVPLQPALLGERLRELAGTPTRRPRLVHDLSFGDRSLILDPPALLPTRHLPPGAVQPGPLFPRLHAPSTRLPPRGARPRLYLSFGATGDRKSVV